MMKIIYIKKEVEIKILSKLTEDSLRHVGDMTLQTGQFLLYSGQPGFSLLCSFYGGILVSLSSFQLGFEFFQLSQGQLIFLLRLSSGVLLTS